MTALLLLVYLQGIVDSITLCTFLLGLLFSITAIAILIDKEGVSKDFIFFAKLSVVFFIISVFTPSKDSISVAAGLYVSSEALDFVSKSEMAAKALKVIDIKLDELVKEHVK